MRTPIATSVCLILLASASAQQMKQTAFDVRSGKAVLEAYVSAWNRHDFAALDKLLTPDAVHEDVAQGVHAQGLVEIKKFMREEIEGEPDIDWRLTSVVDAGPVVAAEWTWTGTFTGEGPSGRVTAQRISGRGASVVVIANGRIKHFTDYYDLASFFPKTATHLSDDEAEIKALYDRWAKAFEAHAIDGIMSNYASGDAVLAYDIAPPLQYKGSDAYRKDYLDFLAQYDGPIHVEYRDMRILSSGDVGFLHALERITGKLKNGEQSDFWLRATSGVRKINGEWLIVHDHLSVPTDFESGKAMLDLKP